MGKGKRGVYPAGDSELLIFLNHHRLQPTTQMPWRAHTSNKIALLNIAAWSLPPISRSSEVLLSLDEEAESLKLPYLTQIAAYSQIILGNLATTETTNQIAGIS